MSTCRDVTALISDGLDGALPWWRRVQLFLHLLLCRHCARFARQLRALTGAIREQLARGHSGGRRPRGRGLSAEARERIRRRLEAEGM